MIYGMLIPTLFSGVNWKARHGLKRLGRKAHNQIWINAPLRRKGLVVVAIPLVFLFLSTLLYNIAANQQLEITNLVRHTLKMRDLIHRLRVVTIEAETGVRGYLLTGNKSFLSPYFKSRIEVKPLLDEATLLLKNDKEQAARLNKFSDYFNQQIDLLNTQLRYVPSGSSPRDVKLPPHLLLQSKSINDKARQQLTAMLLQEEDTLSKRRVQANDTSNKQKLMIDLCALLGLAGGVLAALLFTTGVVHRVQQLESKAHLLATETEVEPNSSGADEIGHLGLALEKASRVLAQRRHDFKESQIRLTALFENTRDSMLLLDDDARLVDVNPAGTRLTARTREDLLGGSLWDIAPADLQPELVEAWKNLSAQKLISGEYLLARSDGNFLDAEISIVANMLPGLHLAVMRDITERKQSVESLKQARAEAERANQAKSEFLSRVSHELRTPLNAILGFAQLMEMDNPPPAYSESIDQILKGGRHLLGLINEVLDIARVESGEISLSPEAVSLKDVVTRATKLMQPLAHSNGITINVIPFDENEFYANADRQRLKQVLLNLLSNAVKYNRPNGSVTIACKKPDNETIRLDVSDTGYGIDAEKLEQLFRPFERLGAEKREIEGTGLGLALSRGLATAMGGSITITQNSDMGMTFTVTLPAAQNPVQELAAAPPEPGEALKPLSYGGNRKVLYVEDNLPNLRVVEYILARQPEVTLIPAMQGSLGIDLARENQPDLIFLDLHLPDIPGDEVLRRLQQDSRTRDIPVVVISADATQKRVQRLLEAGAKAYITKPLDVKLFLEILRDYLGSK